MAYPEALAAHLKTGATTVCRCWAVFRRDGTVHGFTDHDLGLSFDGIDFRADTGLTARAVQQSTGLSVDNTEAVGVLSDPAVRDTDIAAGRFDGAAVKAWLVNWADVSQRVLQFSGTIGEIVRSGGSFRAELRGLAEKLNQPRGRAYQTTCSAVLGDKACKFDLTTPGYFLDGVVATAKEARVITLSDTAGFAEGWFARGVLRVGTGEAKGLSGVIKNDTRDGTTRKVELWEALRAPLAAGDTVRLIAGCDKRAATCRAKFDNFLNFRGFPTIPGEDWLVSYPRRAGVNDGGSLSS